MKFERLNENQIRCTLNRDDLADKELKLSELAYGSPKARALFSELMRQASNELGFEAENTPLMIEAVPVSPDCLILLITKVENPDELDTRFSRFSKMRPFDDADEDEDDYYYDYRHDDDDIDIDIDDIEYSDGADDISDQENIHSANVSIEMNGNPENIYEAIEDLVNHFSSLTGAKPLGSAAFTDADGDEVIAVQAVPKNQTAKERMKTRFRVYKYKDISTVIKVSKLISASYEGSNSLYKDPVSGDFYLMIYQTDDSPEEYPSEYTRICDILGEYGQRVKVNYATPYHFAEHFRLYISEDAVRKLAAL